ncbi:MAG: glycosyltransferase family A protein, partial [Chitinophagaceae bacterium]
MNKFSIILPVRNGGEYVKECVEAILTQSYPEFNLLVLDNCSTDGSLEWMKTLASDRITIFPSQHSLTIEENWSRIVTVPRNEFMTMIGHDDLLHKNYLHEMNELIVKHPSATLYQAHYKFIDAAGKTIR